MRILLATDVFPPRCGGSGWSTYHLARAMRERGHAVAVVRAALDPRAAAPYEYDGFRVEQIAVAVPPAPVLRNLAKNEVFWALGGRALATAARASTSTLDDLGGCAFVSDIMAMQHETQYSRLFRS